MRSVAYDLGSTWKRTAAPRRPIPEYDTYAYSHDDFETNDEIDQNDRIRAGRPAGAAALCDDRAPGDGAIDHTAGAADRRPATARRPSTCDRHGAEGAHRHPNGSAQRDGGDEGNARQPRRPDRQRRGDSRAQRALHR